MLRLFASLFIVSALPAAAAQFLWLSDIHFDPLADPKIVDALAAAEPAQWKAILAGGAAKFPAAGRDSSWPLFSSVLDASGKIIPKTPFVIVTGDLLVHHFREHFEAAATVHDDPAFRSFVRKSVEFVGLQLKERSYGAPVIVTLGNNDDECGDYAIQPGGPFLQDTGKLVKDLTGAEGGESYSSYGSYSLPNPALKHHRIIVLNTVFFSPRHRDLCGQGTEDIGEKILAWLASQLQDAAAHREKVWLVYHIPPGVDAYASNHSGRVTLLWKEAYTAKFVKLLEQYAGTVAANFAGHVHVDDFRLLSSSAVAMLASSVSPITGQNPTFRVVQFDRRGTLKNQSTYYLTNLPEAIAGTQPVWQLEYDFKKTWKLNGLTAANYARLFGQITASDENIKLWTRLYSTSNPHGSAITPETFRQFYCTAGLLKPEAFQACVSGK